MYIIEWEVAKYKVYLVSKLLVFFIFFANSFELLL
jgi:hypothetical protein